MKIEEAEKKLKLSKTDNVTIMELNGGVVMFQDSLKTLTVWIL